MSGPAVVCIKRKRGEQAPDALLLERPGKRLHHSELGGIHYVRQKEQAGEGRDEGGVPTQVDGAGSQAEGSGHLQEGALEVPQRRTFHLKRPVMAETAGGGAGSGSGAGKRRKMKHDGVATFVERNAQSIVRSTPALSGTESSFARQSAASDAPLKRPGRRTAVKITSNDSFPAKAYTQVDQKLASSLHEFAQEVAATEAKPKPRVTAVPKLPPQRSRELHRQSALRHASGTVDHEGDAEMEDEADYVYDTYILAPSSSAGAVQADAHNAIGNVGYLVITDEDQDVWETYLEDEPSDKDWNSDEEDENAEDWYGADYPDDELASDDESGGNDHGYRVHGAADDEEWNEDTGNFSDEEYERQMHPWKSKLQSL